MWIDVPLDNGNMHWGLEPGWLFISTESLDQMTDADIALCMRALASTANSLKPYWGGGQLEPIRVIDDIPPFIHGMEERAQSKTKKRKTQGELGNTKEGFVYVIKGDDYYKIGCTNDLGGRLKAMSVKAPFKLETIILIPTDRMFHTERKLHLKFASQHKRGEWFSLTDEDLDEIRCEYPTIDPAVLEVD